MKLWRYTMWFIVGSVIFALLSIGLAFVGVGLPAGISTVLPVIVAAMNEGMFSARETRAPLAKGRAWIDAGLMTLSVAVINGVLSFFLGLSVLLMLLGGVVIILVVFAIIVFLANRVFLGIGHRMELKRLRLADEDALG